MSGSQPEPASFPAHPTRIILTGFMGAGKTTVGALLAERLGCEFFDSDRLVETRAAMSIAAIFATRGETAFRDLEADVIREALKVDPNDPCEHYVLALGGGALERSTTRDLLASLNESLVVFLEAPLETMIARCAGHDDGPVRPVLADRERLAERWTQRLPWYRHAHLTIDTANLSPEQAVEQILRALAPDRPGNARDGVPIALGAPAKTGARA